jgi:hypothetical protein
MFWKIVGGRSVRSNSTQQHGRIGLDPTESEAVTTADLEAFRDTWTDGPLAKKKKQERLIGFFY